MSERREPEGSPITAVHGSSRGPSASFVLVAVIAVIVAAVGIAVASGTGPGPSPSSVARVSASPSAAVASAPPDPVPSPTVAPPPAFATTVVVLRGQSDPEGALGLLVGCARLNRTSGGPSPTVKGADVDATAASAGRTDGWLFVPPGIQAATKVWLGDDLVGLAQAVGQRLVAVGVDGAVWLGGRSGATRWQPIATPQGRTAWVMTADEVTSVGSCGPGAVPDSIAGLRSVTCAGVGAPACLQDADHTSAILRAAGTDVVVAGIGSCAQACAGDPRIVVSLAGQSSTPTTPVDIAMVGPIAAWLVTDPGYVLPARALNAIAHPALRLPLATGPARACRGTVIEGALQGRPWDPRVAWINAIRVAWPKGTIARFEPGLVLTDAGGRVIARDGDLVEVVGAPQSSGVFQACAAGLRNALRAP